MPGFDGPSPAEERKFRAENDLRILQEAKKIEASPERLADIRQVAEEQLKAAKEATGQGADTASDMLSKGFRKLSDASKG